MAEFRWRDGVAVVFHDDAARKQPLRDQKLFDRAGQCRSRFASVGDNEIVAAHVTTRSSTLKTALSADGDSSNTASDEPERRARIRLATFSDAPVMSGARRVSARRAG